jgi:hypothetical protein
VLSLALCLCLIAGHPTVHAARRAAVSCTRVLCILVRSSFACYQESATCMHAHA